MNPIEKLIKQITDITNTKKAADIRIYKLLDNYITDYTVILSADNTIHCKALLETIVETSKKFLDDCSDNNFYKIPGISGNPESQWVIVDLNSIVIHIMCTEIRVHYSIDRHFEKKGAVYHI
ncbi:MAG: ribosome silencing factor [bacterium]|nr:ribosome silencing factor [bacterium]